MHRSPALSKNICARKFFNSGGRNPIRTIPASPCAVFLNHHGDDTRKTLAGLLYDHLFRMRLRPFLDCRNMKPGDKLFDQIDIAIRNCKVGVALFSPRYCESKFCLYELALIMESKKRVIPIFWDVKPSQLLVKDNASCSVEELQRFSSALEEAKYTVGLAFDSSTGYVLSMFPVSYNSIVLNGIFNRGTNISHKLYILINVVNMFLNINI